MKINIYDEDLNLVAPIGENYVSCLWAEGYNTVESFTLELVATEDYKNKIKPDMFVGRVERDNIMVIKSVQEVGKHLIVSGKQASGVLEDVAFIGTIKADSNIDTSLVEAYNKSTRYKNVVFVESDVNSQYKHQISNKDFLELTQKMCQSKDIGFKSIKEGNKINIVLYKPKNTPIKFSEFAGNVKFDNIISSVEGYKNYAIVLGQGEGEERKKAYVDMSNGKRKRELIVDAKDIQQEENESESDYYDRLEAKGVEQLLEKTKTFSFDITNSARGFGKEYDLGDNVLVLMPKQNLRFATRIVRYEEKSQNNQTEISVTLGELIKMKR